MAAPAQYPFIPPEDSAAAGQNSRRVETLQAIKSAVEDLTPAAEQPLWRRLAYILLATFSLALILPQPVVVSDVLHIPPGFQPFPEAAAAGLAETFTDVWQVERTDDHEFFSNGLRIENTFTVQNEGRFYQVLDRSRDMQPSTEWHSDPVGIVYHATESPLYPFDKDQNANLQRVGKALASLVRDRRSYNFLIDRFGRVFRIVEETDAANHAGNSVWTDGRFVYLNLNSSFVAVAFETATDPQTGLSKITHAQVHAGRDLTQMLRSKYKIPAQNCITHAQVSVNPANMRIGYHTDWAAMFPFPEMGLPNNYDLPVPSVSEFGFEYDDVFRKAVGERAWRGLIAAERQLERDAGSRGVGVDEHRRSLQERYKRLYSALKLTGAVDESVR
jgi:hypothetical protein